MKLDDLITMDRATLEAMVRANPDLVDELVSLAEMAGVEAAISNVNSFISQVLKVEKTTKTGLKAGELVQQAPYHVAFQEALDHPKRNAVIFGHVEQGKCVVSSTIFQLESGEAVTTLELKSRMERGEVCKVLDHDPATGRTEYVRVKEVFYNGVRPCKTVELADRLITYSDEHPMWVRRDGVDAWVPAHEVQRGDHLLTVSPTAEGKPMADGDALLLGMLQPVTRWRHRVLRSWWMGTMQFLSIKHTLLGRLAMPDVAPAFRALLKERGIPYVSEVRKGGRATTTMFDAAWLETWGAYHHIYAKQGSPQCKVRIKFAETSSDMPRAVVAGGHDAALWYIAGTILSAPAVSPDGGLPRVRLISDSGLWLLLDRLRVAYRREYANPTSCKLSLYPCDATDRILDAVGAVCPPLQERVEQECAGRERKERGETSWSRVFRLHDAGEQPTWGVEMCGERHTHVTDGVLTHNTQQLAGRYLWEIGHNPNIRIVHIQATKDQATATSAAIKRYIEEDENYHRIFPHVRPGHPWVDTKWSVERDYNVIHPTFQAAGYRGRVTGNRIDLLGLDDIIDLNNVITQTMRDAVERWIRTVLLNRLTDGGRVWFVGNAWHQLDAMHRLAKEDGWHVAKFPVRDPQTKVPFWTAGWSQERIDETVARIGNPLEVARVLDCVPRSDEAGAFKQIWFDAAFNAGLNIFGPKAYYDKTPPKNWVVFAGLDIAISKSARADLSAIFIFAVMPGGWKVPLRILKGRWDGVEILQTLFAVNWLYQPKRIYVESNAAQDHIRQFLRNPAIMAAVTSGRPDDASLHLPVVPFRTQGTGTRFNKHHKDYGVEGLATEFSAGIWRIPTATIMEEGEDGPVQTQYVDPDILEWVQGMLYYSSEDTHVPDDLMASWFANEGVRSTGGGGMSVSTLEGGQQEERIELVDGDGSPYEMTPRRLSASNSLWDGLREEMGE